MNFKFWWGKSIFFEEHEIVEDLKFFSPANGIESVSYKGLKRQKWKYKKKKQ